MVSFYPISGQCSTNGMNLMNGCHENQLDIQFFLKVSKKLTLHSCQYDIT